MRSLRPDNGDGWMVRELIANFDRWSRLMNRWGFAPNGKTFDALVVQYSDNGRHYHGLEHVSACLRHFDSLAHQLDHDREVELALWFHDAIYQALAADNERQSADWVARFMADNEAGEVEIARVHQLVMATEHRTVAQGHDESILVDIDLAILGAAPHEYDVFEQNVRAEYWM